MQTINAQIHGNIESDSSAGSSRHGHAHVCLVCGRSLLNRQSDLILKENPSSLTLRMIDLIQNMVAPYQVCIQIFLIASNFFLNYNIVFLDV